MMPDIPKYSLRERSRSMSSIATTPQEEAAEFDRVFNTHLSFREIAEHPNVREQCQLTIQHMRFALIEGYKGRDVTERPRILCLGKVDRTGKKTGSKNSSDKQVNSDDHLYIERTQPLARPSLRKSHASFQPVPMQAHMLATALQISDISLNILLLTSLNFPHNFGKYLTKQQSRNNQSYIDLAQTPSTAVQIAKHLLRDYAKFSAQFSRYLQRHLSSQQSIGESKLAHTVSHQDTVHKGGSNVVIATGPSYNNASTYENELARRQREQMHAQNLTISGNKTTKAHKPEQASYFSRNEYGAAVDHLQDTKPGFGGAEGWTPMPMPPPLPMPMPMSMHMPMPMSMPRPNFSPHNRGDMADPHFGYNNAYARRPYVRHHQPMEREGELQSSSARHEEPVVGRGNKKVGRGGVRGAAAAGKVRGGGGRGSAGKLNVIHAAKVNGGGGGAGDGASEINGDDSSHGAGDQELRGAHSGKGRGRGKGRAGRVRGRGRGRGRGGE